METPERSTEPEPSHHSAIRGELAWWRALAISLLAISAIVTFLLVREVRSHRADAARLGELSRQVEASGADLRGKRVADLALVDASGVPTSTRFDASPATLIVLLSDHCALCEGAGPVWAEVASRLVREGLPTRMIVTDATEPASMTERWSGLPPHAVPNAGGTWLRDVPGVPAGVLVDSSGVVRATWLRPIAMGDVNAVVERVQSELTPPATSSGK